MAQSIAIVAVEIELLSSFSLDLIPHKTFDCLVVISRSREGSGLIVISLVKSMWLGDSPLPPKPLVMHTG